MSLMQRTTVQHVIYVEQVWEQGRIEGVREASRGVSNSMLVRACTCTCQAPAHAQAMPMPMPMHMHMPPEGIAVVYCRALG